MRIYCSVQLCENDVRADVTTLPLCYEHGYEIALAFKERILADDRRGGAERLSKRRELAQIKAGNRDGTFVYYALIGGYIKIGWTSRLRERMGAIRADRLLAIEEGGKDLERQRHEDFAADRIDRLRENFNPSPSLEAHIDSLRQLNGLPYWATLPRASVVTTSHKEQP